MTDDLARQVIASGKGVFVLRTEDQAYRFWNEPARGKVVVAYMPGCGWCHRMIPELLKLAPAEATSDLLFAVVSNANMDHISKYLPAMPPINGFPTIIILSGTLSSQHPNRTRVVKVVPGYMPADRLADTIAKELPDIANLPFLVRARSAGDAAAARAPSEPLLPSAIAAAAAAAAPAPATAAAAAPASLARPQVPSTAGAATALPPPVVGLPPASARMPSYRGAAGAIPGEAQYAVPVGAGGVAMHGGGMAGAGAGSVWSDGVLVPQVHEDRLAARDADIRGFRSGLGQMGLAHLLSQQQHQQQQQQRQQQQPATSLLPMRTQAQPVVQHSVGGPRYGGGAGRQGGGATDNSAACSNPNCPKHGGNAQSQQN
jgi:hypothetical protein